MRTFIADVTNVDLYDFKEVRFKKRGILGKIRDFIRSLV